MYLENTILFYRPDCPYCHKVLTYMEEHNLDCEKRNIYEGDHQLQLEETTGQTAVPAMLVNGEPIVGSDVIIEYLQQYA